MIAQGNCVNKNSACDRWAKEGFCDKKDNEEWMWKNCCSACNAGRNIILYLYYRLVTDPNKFDKMQKLF